jgi:ParB-like chromosome segregation protein Spo0J
MKNASPKTKAKPAASKKTAGKSKTPPPPAKARRLEDIAEGRKGLFCIDPTLITVEPGFNKRVNYGNLQQLADDIAANGLDQPLKVRKLFGTETIYVVSGHRRHKAITEILIPAGRWHDDKGKVKTVDCYAEAQGTTKVERLISQIAGNTGLAYSLLEKAEVYKEILAEDSTIKPADLSRRFGESKQAVSDAMRLINDGSHCLLDAIEEGIMAASTAIAIIKASSNSEDQYHRLEAAKANALAAGRIHIMPKDIPGKETESSTLEGGWIYTASQDYEWNKNKVSASPNVLSIPKVKGITRLEISTAQDNKGKWYFGYQFEYSTLGGGRGPNLENTSHHTEAEAIRAAWDSLCKFNLRNLGKLLGGQKVIAQLTALGHALSAIYPTGTPWDESILTSEDDQSDPSDSSDLTDTPPWTGEEPDESPVTSDPQYNTRFTLHLVDGAPTDPIKEGSPFYHETDRMCLEAPHPDIQRLHLLIAMTPHGAAYGYRIGDYERLPDTSHIETLDSMPDTALKEMLALAISNQGLPDATVNALEELLYDALCRYYPETGEAEEPRHIAFVATSPAQAPELSGYDAIVNAPTGGSGGSSGGGGGSTYLDPQTFKAVQKIEDVLEKLADKNQGIPERVTVADIVIGVLRNERPASDLRNYLLGK